MTELVRLIKLKDETHEELKTLGAYGDTMDTIVKKLIKSYKEKAKK